MDDYGGADYGDEWAQEYGQEDGWGEQEEEKFEVDEKPAEKKNMLTQFSKCPKSADGKFIFITYEDVLKLFPIKIQ